MKTDRSNNPLKGDKKTDQGALKHMGLATTMAAGIGGGAWLGSVWDEHGGHEVAWATALGAMVGLSLSLMAVFQDLKR
ncbi:hypothetical protein OAO65_04845 [Flavobacteriales bacterium]|nr:hypothetical protein [Flavobacteriales bacterium]